MNKIYKHLNFCEQPNQVKSFKFIYNILNLDKTFSLDLIKEFYYSYELRDECILVNGAETFSLTELIAICPYKHHILNHEDIIKHTRDLNYFLRIGHNLSVDEVYLVFMKNKNKSDEFIKFCIEMIKLHPDDKRIVSIVDFLPDTALESIKLTKHTFSYLLKRIDNNLIPKLMAYEITTHEEYDILVEALKQNELKNTVYRYIQSQGVINNTILYCGIITNLNFKNITNFCNLNIKRFLGFCDKESVFMVENDVFKNILNSYVLENYFDLELFIFSITTTTCIKFKNLINIKNDEFNWSELFLMYFYRKCNITSDSKILEKDVIEIIENRIYNIECLKLIINNGFDYNLFGKTELQILSDEKDVQNILVQKYYKKLIENDLNVDSTLFKKYKDIHEFLYSNTKIEFLPIVSDYSQFHDNEIIKMVNNYYKNYTINDFIHIFIQIHIKSDDKLIYYFDKIEKPVNKLIILLNYNLKILNKEEVIEKNIKRLTNNDIVFLLKEIHSYYGILKYFYIKQSYSLSINRDIVSNFYSRIENKEEFIKSLSDVTICHNFIKHFLPLLFKDGFEPSFICECINKLLIKNNFEETIIIMCIRYYLDVVLRNEFFQELTLVHVRDFLNILYLFMMTKRKNFEIYKYCETIISRIKKLSVFFNCELILKNIKSISMKIEDVKNMDN